MDECFECEFQVKVFKKLKIMFELNFKHIEIHNCCMVFNKDEEKNWS